jgi:hypothetical protein
MFILENLFNMKKVLYLLTILIGVSLSGFSQTKDTVKLSIGGEFGLPGGPASSFYGTVIGVSLKLEVPVHSNELYVTGTVGFSDFLAQLDYRGTAKIPGASYAPLEIGGKYYFAKHIYFEGDAGVSFNTGNYGASSAAFIYAPVIGVTAQTNKHKAWLDMGVRYEGRVEGGQTISQVALRVAYRFKI